MDPMDLVYEPFPPPRVKILTLSTMAMAAHAEHGPAYRQDEPYRIICCEWSKSCIVVESMLGSSVLMDLQLFANPLVQVSGLDPVQALNTHCCNTM